MWAVDELIYIVNMKIFKKDLNTSLIRLKFEFYYQPFILIGDKHPIYLAFT